MKRKIFFKILWKLTLFLLITCSGSGMLKAQSTISFYVDPINGKDSNSGKSIQAPFQSLKKAKETVRSINKINYNEIEINLRNGIYFQNETLVFNENDGGKGTSKILYKNYNNEKTRNKRREINYRLGIV